LEALASGCKVIAPTHSGFGSVKSEIRSFGIPLISEPINGRYICDGSTGPFDLVKVGTGDTWYECNVDDVQAKMRLSFEAWKMETMIHKDINLSRFCHRNNAKKVLELV
jgi:hypothetical protein